MGFLFPKLLKIEITSCGILMTFLPIISRGRMLLLLSGGEPPTPPPLDTSWTQDVFLRL